MNLALQAIKVALTPEGGKKHTLVVGILKGATRDVDEGKTGDSVPIAPYAAMMEFGTKHVPARPFLRTTLAERQSDWSKTIALLMQENGVKDLTKALNLLGIQMTGDIKAKIMSGAFAPLSPKTIAAKERKGRPHPDLPLVDTASMVNAIHHEVRK
jgi:hypothetical protein